MVYSLLYYAFDRSRAGQAVGGSFKREKNISQTKNLPIDCLVLRYVTWCNAMSCGLLSCDELSSVATRCDAMGWHLMGLWCDVAGCDVTLCGSKSLCDVATWKIIWRSVLQSTTRYYAILQSTTPYYTLLQNTTQYYKALLRTTRYYKVLQKVPSKVWFFAEATLPVVPCVPLVIAIQYARFRVFLLNACCTKGSTKIAVFRVRNLPSSAGLLQPISQLQRVKNRYKCSLYTLSNSLLFSALVVSQKGIALSIV